MLELTRYNHQSIHVGRMRATFYCVNENYVRIMICNKSYKLNLGSNLIINGIRIRYVRYYTRYKSACVGIDAPPQISIVSEELLAS